MSHPYKSRPVAGTHVWLTPPKIVKSLGPFDLDPCAAPHPRPWPTATRMVSLPEDGLSIKWKGRVWLNPPFGRETSKWLARMAEHNWGIALCFARTETTMFRDYVWRVASGIKFLEGRPHFYHRDGSRAKGSSGGPIVLISYGLYDFNLLMVSGLPGRVVKL